MQDHVGLDRRAIEDEAAQRIRYRTHDRRGGGAERRLADALRAHRAGRVRLVHPVGVELRGQVEIGRGPRLVQPYVAGQAILRIEDDVLQGGHADALHRGTLELRLEPHRVDDGAAVADVEQLDDAVLSRLHIQLDLDEGARECRGLAPHRQIVLRHPDQARAGQCACRGARHGIDVGRQLLSRVAAAEGHCALRDRRVGQMFPRMGFCENLLAVDLVVVGLAAQIVSSDLLDLLQRVHGRDIVRAGHGERGVAAELPDVPRQMLARVAALDDAVLPIVLEGFGGNACRARVRERSQIADAGMNMELAVQRDANETVEPAESGRVVRLAYAHARDLGTLALAAARQSLLPVEARRALVQGIVEVGARDGPAVGAHLRAHRRRVDLAQLQPVDIELAGRLVHQGLEDAGDLILTGAALRRARRRVGVDRYAAPAHRLGLVDDRERIGGVAKIPESVVCAAVLDDVHVGREQPAVGAEAELHAPLEAVARTADVVLLRAADAHHHRLAQFPGQQRRDRHARIRRALGAEAAAAELGDVVELIGLDADVLGELRQDERLALRRAVDEALAVLPVREGGARLHAVVRNAARDEGLVQDELGLREARLDIPVYPVLSRLAHGHPPVRLREVRGRPLDRLQLQSLRADIAVEARIRSIGMQALQRIDGERQRLQIQLDLLDGILRRRLIHRCYREDGLTDVLRLFGENGRIGRWHRRHLIGQQHAHDSRHAQCRGNVDAPDEGVRHGTGEQSAENHAVRPKVLRIFRLSRHLGHDVGRDEVLAQELVGHVDDAPAARITPLR